MRSPELGPQDQAILDLHASKVVLQFENEELRQQVSFLESQVESLREALDLVSREI